MLDPNSAGHNFSTAHSFTKRKWDQPREQGREEKEDKNNNLTPLGLKGIRNGEEEEWELGFFLFLLCPTVRWERDNREIKSR